MAENDNHAAVEERQRRVSSAAAELGKYTRSLPYVIRGSFPDLSLAEAEDAVSEALIRTLERVERGPSSIEHYGAYLATAARRIAIDRLWDQRRLISVSDVLDSPLSDDATAEAFAAGVTPVDIRLVLRRLREAGDPTLFKIVAYMLDTLAATGKVPSNRDVARATNLSHTGVAKALVRLRPYFEELR